MKRLLFAVLLSVLGSAALAQSFSDEPTDALKATQGLAQEIVNDPLRLEGLISVVFRYNAFRAEVAPAGHESQDWYQGQVQPLLIEIAALAQGVKDVAPLDDEQLNTLASAFGEFGGDFYGYYGDAQGALSLSNIPPDQFLRYLGAFAHIVNTADPEAYQALVSFTGIWPLCFWDTQ